MRQLRQEGGFGVISGQDSASADSRSVLFCIPDTKQHGHKTVAQCMDSSCPLTCHQCRDGGRVLLIWTTLHCQAACIYFAIYCLQ